MAIRVLVRWWDNNCVNGDGVWGLMVRSRVVGRRRGREYGPWL